MTNAIIDRRFNACLPFTLKEEGGNDDDPHDHGGRTSRGITQREYDRWRHKWKQSIADVWQASSDEIRAIYYGGYWLPTCPSLPPGVDLCYFDHAVNAGPRRATVILQALLDIKESSNEFARGYEHVGPVTLAALAKADPADVVRKFSAHRQAFYRGLSQFSRYGAGWTARNRRITAAALGMAKLAAPPPPPPVQQPKEPPPMTTTPPPKHTLPPPPAAAPAAATTTAAASTDLIATALTALQSADKFSGLIGSLIGAVIPGAGIIVPNAIAAAEFLLEVVEDIKGKQGLDIVSAIAEALPTLQAHLTGIVTAIKTAQGTAPPPAGAAPAQ